MKQLKGSSGKFNPMKQMKAKLMDRLTTELEEQGATIFKPKEMEGTLNVDIDYLSIPSDLTEVPSRDLGKYLNTYTQNKAYMRTLYNWQECLVEECKRKYDDKYIVIYKEITKESPKMSEKGKELYCNDDDYVREEYLAYKDEKLKLGMLSHTIASYEEIIFLISREISRRSQDTREYTRMDNLK